MTSTATVPSIVLTDKQFRLFSNLTADNAHTDCYLAVTKALGLTDLHERFAKLQRTQERQGHLDWIQMRQQREGYEEMLRLAMPLLGPEQHKRLYGCL